MAVKYIDKVCAICGYKQELLVSTKDDTNNILHNLNNYINFNLEVCPKCGYISNDLQINYSSFNNVKNNQSFKNATNYLYLPDNDFYEKLMSYPANLYEGFALICENHLDYENAIRAYFRTVVLKNAICSVLEQEKLEDLEDLDQNEINQYNTIISGLNNSAKQNLQKIISIYDYSKKSLYTKLILVKVYLMLDDLTNAELLFDSMKELVSDIDIKQLY